MLSPSFKNITLDSMALPELPEKQINLSVLRLDKLDPVISGNKWFKLRFYADEAVKENKSTLITFGGAWSNHIIATAAYCRMLHIKSVGIIRGEQPLSLSPMLTDAQNMGMELVFISRNDFRKKTLPREIQQLMASGKAIAVPEGGYGEKGMLGAATIAELIPQNRFTHICCAAGTGTMIAGIACKTASETIVTGVSVLKNNTGIMKSIDQLINDEDISGRISIFHEYHFGGYAKHTQELTGFMNNLYRNTGIPSDFVYTGKLFYAVNDLLNKNYFPAGSNILLVHSGGLQGNRSLKNGTLIF